MNLAVLALELSWDPGIRGIGVVVASVAVLCGSVYLVVATNTGARLGFLIAAAGLSGWMLIMGAIWWMYGIGYVGDSPVWRTTEVVVSDSEVDLEAANLPDARDLSDWEPLPEGGGDAAAEADHVLTDDDSPVAQFDSTSDYLMVRALETGGKEGWRARIPVGPHPPHYAVIQVQPVVDQGEPEFGQPPPPAERDESAPVTSVVMIRDLGDRRLPPALITLASGILFAVCCSALHRRDKLLAQARAGAATS